ncbi:hypothetical protein ACIA5D_27035 [Actinoplanes sp. NPDC051513]|uniref:hypothetical protein n=1 Tax=Actinoplanes sp. NPDC051513 TaxID=3363908 RepID=UPI0037976673
MLGSEPAWSDLDDLASSRRLTEEGVATLRWAYARLRSLLGDSWLTRQYRKQGRLPGELLFAGTHRYALPQALSLVLRLDHDVSEPTFAKVKAELRRGADSSLWRHVLLQLEVARAARDRGSAVMFEPAIPGSKKRGDLLIDGHTDQGWLVETTTVPRAAIDLDWQDYEVRLRHAIHLIEQRYGVTCVVCLDDHMVWEDTQNWIAAIDENASSMTGALNVHVVPSEIGAVTVYRGSVPEGTVVFSGAAQYRDGWHRLGRTLSTKAVQVRGPWPAWIRVDCLDGLFQFTEWAQGAPSERLQAIAAAIHTAVRWPDNAEGVVLSTGPAVSLGATDSAQENVGVQTADGVFVRRLLARHLVRETVVIPLPGRGKDRAKWWADAYGREPGWLDEDLEGAGRPRLDHLWRNITPTVSA